MLALADIPAVIAAWIFLISSSCSEGSKRTRVKLDAKTEAGKMIIFITCIHKLLKENLPTYVHVYGILLRLCAGEEVRESFKF